MKNKRSRKNLDSIRDLIDGLSDRDVKIKRDVKMFEDFFDNFPIPVTIWFVSKEGTVVSQRGDGIINQSAKSIECLFEGCQAKDKSNDLHRKAFEGQSSQTLVSEGEKLYYMSIIPRRNEQGDVSGAAGLAWDVSPNNTMLEVLKKIEDITRNTNDEQKISVIKDINDLASKGLSASRLNKLINVGIENEPK